MSDAPKRTTSEEVRELVTQRQRLLSVYEESSETIDSEAEQWMDDAAAMIESLQARVEALEALLRQVDLMLCSYTVATTGHRSEFAQSVFTASIENSQKIRKILGDPK